jgi:hypothetical protein
MEELFHIKGFSVASDWYLEESTVFTAIPGIVRLR